MGTRLTRRSFNFRRESSLCSPLHNGREIRWLRIEEHHGGEKHLATAVARRRYPDELGGGLSGFNDRNWRTAMWRDERHTQLLVAHASVELLSSQAKNISAFHRDNR
jgi:hypothetical protein